MSLRRFAFAGGGADVPFDAARDFALGRAEWSYAQLYAPDRLAALDAEFRRELAAADRKLAARFEAYRGGATLPPVDESDLLIAVARHLSHFVAALFRIDEARRSLVDFAARERAVFRMKEFVQRRAIKKYGRDALVGEEGARLFEMVRAEIARGLPELVVPGDEELTIARAVSALLDREQELRADIAADAAELAQVRGGLDIFERWAALHHHDPATHRAVASWVSFRFPHQVDYEHLVPLRPHHARRRDGFHLTDRRMSRREILSEIDYCLYCHEREKDSCSRGLRAKDGTLKHNPIGVALSGCPLDERISEMHVLKRDGDSLAALAMIAIDNPMVPGTGHRICNDCMKGCIFQKQDPVNIPQAETGILTDVLGLPYGFEIYTLLTRWNPLNRARPYALPYNGKNILVVGLGPAGYTLAHHLLNQGFGVIGVDGLKIEPLPASLIGGDVWPPRAIKRLGALEAELDRRVLVGFGGVAEYGITVRWDKNFLTAIHLALARRPSFRAYGGVRFGGTLDADEAFRIGFDHVAIAAGAGKPTLIGVKNNLIRGVRKASDFLMALQLTGAFKQDSLASLQVRLPAVVVGGGLTAIDTTTELAAYYPVQVEKFLDRWDVLASELGDEMLWRMYDEEEAEVAREFLAHGRAVRAERARAQAAGEAPNLSALVASWGGVSLVYRKTMRESPAYRLNHEEIIKFLEEGVRFLENLAPVECVPDRHGAIAEVIFEEVRHEGPTPRGAGERVRLPARTLMVAAGTSPNITYEREHPGSFEVDPERHAFRSFRAVPGPDGRFRLEPPPPGTTGFFTSYERDGRFITFYGDNHPVYAGSVVKAMASAKDGVQHVVALFAEELARLRPELQPERDRAWEELVRRLDRDLRPTVEEVRRLTPTIVEVVVRAPAAARRFRPGTFFRLQNYELLAPALHGSRLQMEGLALTGAWVDERRGLLSLIVLELGGSSRLCAALGPGDPVVVMGPTGTPTEIPRGEKVALCGGGLGNAVLFSIARALRDNGCSVLYFAGYRKREDIYKVEEIEAATAQVVWSVDAGPLPVPRRPQDRAFLGNLVEAMVAYAKGDLGPPAVPLAECSRIIAIGSDRMMAAVQRARHGVLGPYLRAGHVAIASINSPMQCMMKEVCAQCMQKHRDPVTGQETVVFSCFAQDQPQDAVDWDNLADRLRQNTVQEKMTDRWVRRALASAAGQR